MSLYCGNEYIIAIMCLIEVIVKYIAFDSLTIVAPRYMRKKTSVNNYHF